MLKRVLQIDSFKFYEPLRIRLHKPILRGCIDRWNKLNDSIRENIKE